MDLIKADTAVLEHFPGHPCLEYSVVGQRCVGPSNETIVAVPGALTVAQKTEIVGRIVVDTDKGTSLSLVL